MTRQDELLAEYVAKSKSASFRRLNSPTVQLKYAYPLPADHPPLASRLPDAKPQRVHRQKQIRDAATPQESSASTCVIITRCAPTSLDRDNLIGGAKATCDSLRYGGHIDGDTERHIELFVFQKKVKRKDAGTLIEIIRLTSSETSSTAPTPPPR